MGAAGDLQLAVNSYLRRGYVVLRDVLDAGTVAACLHHLENLQAAPAFSGRDIVAPPLSDGAFLGRIAADVRVSGLAASLLGNQVVPFGCTYMIKRPRSGLPAIWHQDGHPWHTALGISSAVTLWIALDPADSGNGALQVVPGSHRRPAEPLQKVTDPPNLFGWGMDPAGVDPDHAVTLSLDPGDVSAHHPNLVHGSPANRSDRPRRALAIRYRPA